MSKRPILDESKVSPNAQSSIAAFHAATVSEVAATVERDPVVVVGMGQNPFVKKARKALADAGIAFTYLEYGSYFGEWKKRLAIKMWSGFPTFPQVYVRGTLIGGFDDTTKAIADGSLKQRLGS
jgi:glutaredoxin-related protein